MYATFGIPTRIECEQDAKNLLWVVNFLLDNFFEAKIIVAECGDKPSGALDSVKDKIDYMFIRSNKYIKHKLINAMVRQCATDIFIIHNDNCIISKEQYNYAIRYIINDEYDIVYPYSSWVEGPGLFPETDEPNLGSLGVLFRDNKKELTKQTGKVGGIVVCKTLSLVYCGLINEYLINTKYMDHELYDRFRINKYRVRRIPGDIYSFWSEKEPEEEFLSDEEEYTKIAAWNVPYLTKYVRTWPWAWGVLPPLPTTRRETQKKLRRRLGME